MDYKKNTSADLSKMLSERRSDLRNFRFGSSGSKTKNIKKGKEIRKNIARILTELNIRK